MEWAWLIPVFSFIAVPLIVLFGSRLPAKGAFLAILAMLGGIIVFAIVAVDFLQSGSSTNGCGISEFTKSLTCLYSIDWFEAGSFVGDSSDGIRLVWGMLLDPLTVLILGLITIVALMVQIYSLGYMHGDPRFGWYYAFHALFAASMLTLVLADNFLLLYVAWELVGVCSYLLIGFWFERPSAREAAKKAFIVTRLGDVGLLIGILLLWSEVGSFSMVAAFEAANNGSMSQLTATVAALLLFAGAAGKSAQFPMHVWLPDAMEGPTPVSALIHAATMVIAGVYLVARSYPIFVASGDALTVVAWIGLITAFGAATIALTATDLKRILAYSTISHLGLMMLSLGAFGYTAAIFHLLAHGFAKALLFLGAGSVMHSIDELDIRKMGGLRKVMPLTALLFSIGALSLGGIPILSGFWSKDEILIAVSEHLPPVFIVLTFMVAFMSALYMGRAMFAVFFGKLNPEHEHAHDAPMSMAVTMSILGVFALVFGLVSLDWPGSFNGIGTLVYFEKQLHFHLVPWIAGLSTILAVLAFVLAYFIYARKRISLDSTRAKFNWLHKIVENKYYLDECYQWIVETIVLTSARLLGLFDRVIVNDIGVNGPGWIVKKVGISMKIHITGHVYSYALGTMLGTIVLGVMWWLRSVD